jgi:hypothetical protein
MLHFKCVTCRIRVAGPGDATDAAADLCPGCGSALEPVRNLSEIFGFQAVARDAEPATAHGAAGYRGLAARVHQLRDRDRQPSELDAARWLDDGGSFSREAVSRATTPP